MENKMRLKLKFLSFDMMRYHENRLQGRFPLFYEEIWRKNYLAFILTFCNPCGKEKGRLYKNFTRNIGIRISEKSELLLKKIYQRKSRRKKNKLFTCHLLPKIKLIKSTLEIALISLSNYFKRTWNFNYKLLVKLASLQVCTFPTNASHSLSDVKINKKRLVCQESEMSRQPVVVIQNETSVCPSNQFKHPLLWSLVCIRRISMFAL
jgi:hypothetical protein